MSADETPPCSSVLARIGVAAISYLVAIMLMRLLVGLLVLVGLDLRSDNPGAMAVGFVIAVGLAIPIYKVIQERGV